MKKVSVLFLVCIAFILVAFVANSTHKETICCKQVEQKECRPSAPASTINDVKNEILMKF